MGRTDKLPEELAYLNAHKLLWHEYGVPFDSMLLSDAIRAIALETALKEREEHDRTKAGKA